MLDQWKVLQKFLYAIGLWPEEGYEVPWPRGELEDAGVGGDGRFG